MSGDLLTFRFRVTGIEDTRANRSSYVRRYDETFEIVAEQVGDALNELINRSGMWDSLDQECDFTIYYIGVDAP